MDSSEKKARSKPDASLKAKFELKNNALREFALNDPFLSEHLKDVQKSLIFRKFTIFLSVSDKKTRAKVFHSSADTLSDAWNTTASKIRRYIDKSQLSAIWLKADIVTDCDVINYEIFKENITSTREFFYKKGIAFDTDMNTAILSDELNTLGLINYKQRFLSLPKLRRYYQDNDIKDFNIITRQVITFDSQGYFIDENKELYKLYSDEENHGRRVINELTKPFIKDIIESSSRFIVSLIKDNGRFDYGINPVSDFHFTTYNMLRHTGTIWSILMQYQTTRDPMLIPKIDSTIKYMQNDIVYKDDKAYLLERKADEIKLGGNAVTVITLTTYMDVFKNDIYMDLIKKLGNAILDMQEPDGSYYHVLNSEDFSRKERVRIVYYDGEATFALALLYRFTKDEKYLDAACKAIDYFIDNRYEKFRDHWIAYAVNEVTKSKPLDRYLSFGLRNAQVNLDRIYKQDTSYHTYMELLMATFEMYQRIAKDNIAVSYLREFDTDKFIKTIYRRANHMLNGYMFPEIAMYMAKPETILHAFDVRHDSFRIRIDDIQHFIGGYFKFYQHFDELQDYYNTIFPEGNNNNEQ